MTPKTELRPWALALALLGPVLLSGAALLLALGPFDRLQVAWTAGTALVVNSATAAGLFLGVRRGTTAVFGAFVGGFFLKLLGILAVFLALRAAGRATAYPLLLLLILYFLSYVWTTWRFHVYNTGKKP